ncbi:MAG: aminotransferase class V-fold PLP-dependent enzyme [Thermoplasmatales archaeon]|nr:aminotransferase class V-fold PLP-dependent enzyme [Thermoplasmatales archaeon]
MLLIPGPVDVPGIVKEGSAYVQNHRSPEFKNIVAKCRELLTEFSGSSESVATTGSGTTAVESMIYSFNKPRDEVLCFSFGEFGNRLADSIRNRGCNLTLVGKGENTIIEKGEVSDYVRKNKGISSLYLVHNETGNGTELKNLKEIVSEAKSLGLNVYVDSVSGFGATEIAVDNWGIDAVATCSQKGLASVPGLGIVLLGKDTLDKLRNQLYCPAYLNLAISVKFFQKNETPYTPSTGSFRSLYYALQILKNEGLVRRWKRHEVLSRIVRETLIRMGVKIYGTSKNFSNSVIAFDPGVPVEKFVYELANEDIIVSRGMGSFRDSMVRVGILGVVDNVKISRFLNASSKILGSSERVDPENFPEESRFYKKWLEIDR